MSGVIIGNQGTESLVQIIVKIMVALQGWGFIKGRFTVVISACQEGQKIPRCGPREPRGVSGQRLGHQMGGFSNTVTGFIPGGEGFMIQCLREYYEAQILK